MPDHACVLVVDDDPAILQLIQDTLSPEYTIDTASDVLQAVDCITFKPYQLLILDLDLPVMNGIEFVETLRRDAGTVPVLAISAHPELIQLLDSGLVQAILPKPFKLADLRRSVGDICKGAAAPVGSPGPSPE